MAGLTSTVFHFLSTLVLGHLFLLSTSSHGQSDVEPVYDAAYARFGSKLYVVGGVFSRAKGTTIANPTFGDGQAIVLDLSVSWDAAKPSWRRLRSGPRLNDFASALNANGSKLITFRSESSSSYARLYDIATDTWSSSNVTVTEPTRVGLSAVTDPTTNKVYLPFGSWMHIYDFNTDTMTRIESPSSTILKSMYTRGVWWPKRQCIIYFGGYLSYEDPRSLASNHLSTYTPSSNIWDILKTNGMGPSSRSGMCMEISDDGETLVVFGGRVTLGISIDMVLSEISVLDLNTLTWTRGNDNLNTRTNAICTLYNGTFLIWGGTDLQQSIYDSMVVYDVKRNLFLDRYDVNRNSKSLELGDGGESDNPTMDSGSSPSYGLSTGTIIGAFIAAAVGTTFIMCTISYKMYNRKRPSELSPFQFLPMYLRSSRQELLQVSPNDPQDFGDAPLGHILVSPNDPQSLDAPPQGYILDLVTRGPEAISIEQSSLIEPRGSAIFASPTGTRDTSRSTTPESMAKQRRKIRGRWKIKTRK